MATLLRLLTAAAVLAFALALPLPAAADDALDFRALSAEWWQWLFSLPPAVNPNLDPTGEACALGQRGSIWFLAGTFGGEATRHCIVPEDVTLFFPVANGAFFDSPGQCGQGPDSVPVPEMRAFLADFVAGVVDLEVELNGRRVHAVRRARSAVFAMALPPDNLAGPGCPAGVYSPAVSDGYWARIRPLPVGTHTVRFASANPDVGFSLDVTYHLTVVPVLP